MVVSFFSAIDCFFIFFFFNDTATTEIYTLSLHDALPISSRPRKSSAPATSPPMKWARCRSEEHTSELQSPVHLVCRLLLEKKKTKLISIFLYGKHKTAHKQNDADKTR